MTDAWSTPLVVGLCIVAIIAAFALVRRLMWRPSLTLRAKSVTLIIGLVGVELAILPALFVVLAGDNLLGLRGSGIDHWIVIVVYGLLTLYVIVRLFPWHEVQVLAADPNTTLRDTMAKIVAKDRKR